MASDEEENRLVAERRQKLRLLRENGVAFPNTFAGSIPPYLVGRFSYPWFLLALPLGILWSRVNPNGNQAFWLVKEQRE